MTETRTGRGRKIEIAPATAADAGELAAGMREADRIEVALMAGLTPSEAAFESLAVSDAAFSLRVGGRLHCVCGVSLGSLLEADATVWMLCTDAPERHPRDFVAAFPAGIARLKSEFPDVDTVTNLVWKGNAAAVRWLEWAGAWFSTAAAEKGALGGVFLRFTIDIPDADRKGRRLCAICK
jgi:hypothetical protein